MAIPKDLRQRMINVMYVVLLALLALQIPQEITEAFIKINKGIEESSKALGGITQANIQALEFKGKNGDKLAQKYSDQSKELNTVTIQLNNYIASMKQQIVDLVGTDEEGNILTPEETVLTAELLIKGNENGINDGVAFGLKDKIADGLKEMLIHFPKEKMETKKEGSFDKLVASLPIYELTYGEVDNNKWVLETFDGMPAAGAITMLSQIQSDIHSSENKLIEEMKNLVGAGLVFDEFKAKITAPSSYILRGEKFTADLFLAASSSQTDNIVIHANGRNYKPNSNGVVNFEALGNSVGQHKVKGYISMKDPSTGKTDKYDFKDFTYTVSDPFANVSPLNLNVFYIGLDNPVSASAAGVLAKDVDVSISHGSIKKKDGNYVVNVSERKDATITVKDKKGKVHGSFPFRVKRVPDPIAKVGNKTGGQMRTGVFKAQKRMTAEMDDFLFPVNYKIISYTMVYMPRGKDLGIANMDSEAFNSLALGFLNRARPGDRFAFEDIKVKGPDGSTRDIPGITFKLR